MKNNKIRHALSIPAFIVMTSFLLSCSTHSETAELKIAVPALDLPVLCKKMAPIMDIWKLEPILVKKGKIKEDMDKAEKEKVIRHYINNKTKQYKICLKSKN
ncbi:MAG: hypothetical protein COB38_04870 [Gammaproteobacteria bacterium]|nr:MAG: hypothetical protein COB38_04870 [Gammaproteobacteria bacterium]